MKIQDTKTKFIHIVEKYFPIIALVLFTISYLSFIAAQNMLMSLIFFIITFIFVIPLAIFEDEIDDDKAILMPKL